MLFVRLAAVCSVALSCGLVLAEGPGGEPGKAAVNLPSTAAFQPVVFRPAYESSSEPFPSAPGEVALRSGAGAAGAMGAGEVVTTSTRPFSAVALQVKVGAEGFGFDVATPLSKKLNLRAGASFFSYSTTLTEDGINIGGTVTFRKVDTLLDFFPTGGSFRLSAGVVFYNGNHLTATANVPGGGTFTLNDIDYTSGDQNNANPVSGSFDLKFGNKVAPIFTTGFGNMLPRRAGKHFSVPFEIGFEYISTPLIALNLSGFACQVGQPKVNGAGCNSIASDPTTQQNIVQEQNDLNSDISPLRFYPVLSIGIAYKFGK